MGRSTGGEKVRFLGLHGVCLLLDFQSFIFVQYFKAFYGIKNKVEDLEELKSLKNLEKNRRKCVI